MNVLYIDYKEDIKNLSKILKKNNIKFDSIDDILKEKDLISANEAFKEKYLSNLGDYDVLIAHLGIIFNNQIPDILSKYQKLNLVLVSDYGSNLVDHGKRYLVCNYDSNLLIPFIKSLPDKNNKTSNNKHF